MGDMAIQPPSTLPEFLATSSLLILVPQSQPCCALGLHSNCLCLRDTREPVKQRQEAEAGTRQTPAGAALRVAISDQNDAQGVLVTAPGPGSVHSFPPLSHLPSR